MNSITTSTDGTVLYYDHWEDDYAENPADPGPTTQVWGDGYVSNSCYKEGGGACAHNDDHPTAGQALIAGNATISLPRQQSDILYDGGDRIQATNAVAVTRGAFPAQPGSLMAGAIEVMDTSGRGTRSNLSLVPPITLAPRHSSTQPSTSWQALT